MYKLFIADCKREMQLRKMTNATLAEAVGVKTSTINAFFADVKGREKSERVAKAISQVLQIEI